MLPGQTLTICKLPRKFFRATLEQHQKKQVPCFFAIVSLASQATCKGNMSWNELLQHPQERPVFFHRESFWQMDLFWGDVLVEPGLSGCFIMCVCQLVKLPYFGQNSYLLNLYGTRPGWRHWVPVWMNFLVAVCFDPCNLTIFQQRFSLFDIRFFCKTGPKHNFFCRVY